MSYTELMDVTHNYDMNNPSVEFEELLKNIEQLTEESKKNDVCHSLLKRLKESIIEMNFANKEELKDTLEGIKGMLSSIITNFDFDKYFIDNSFDLDSIIRQRKEKGIEFSETRGQEGQEENKDKEIDKINERIKEIENNYLNHIASASVLNSLKEKLEEVNNRLQTENDEKKAERIQYLANELVKDIEKLTKDNKKLSNDEIKNIAEKYDMSYDDIINSIKANNPDIKDELPSLDTINSELERLNNEKQEKEHELEELDIEIADLETKIEKEEKELEQLKNSVGSEGDTSEDTLTPEEEKEMQEIIDALERRQMSKYASKTDSELLEELQRLDIEKKSRQGQVFDADSDDMDLSVNEIEDQISEIKAELARRNRTGANVNEFTNLSNEDLENKITELENSKTDLMNNRLTYINKEVLAVLNQKLEDANRNLEEHKNLINSPNPVYPYNMGPATMKERIKRIEEMAIPTLKQDIERLNQGILTEEELKEIADKYYIDLYSITVNATNTLTEETKKIDSEIKKIQEEKNRRSQRRTTTKYANMTEEELNIKLMELQIEKRRIQGQIFDADSDDMDLSVNEIEKQISEIKKELARRHTSDVDLKRRLEELQKKKKSSGKSNKDITEKEQSIKDKKEKLQGLKDKREELKNNIEDINNKISEYEKLKKDAQELNDLKAIKAAYDDILKEGITKFKENEENDELLNNIIDFVNNHPKTTAFGNYENKDKLKKELAEDIHNAVRTRKVDKTEKDTKLWVKALAGAAGFVAGLGVSCVPGVGTITMGLAGAKLIGSTINFWTKNHPNGKIAKIVNPVKERFNESWLGRKTAKIREFLNKPTVKWAVNGFAAGYITGNIIELLTGKTVWQHIKPEPAPTPTPAPNPIPQGEEVTILPEPVVPSIDPPVPGKVLDLSGIEFGRVSSDALNGVHLNTSVAKEVIFDKIKILPNGQEMWHFKQMNDLGYAWFTKEEVMALLTKQAKAVVDTASRVM